MSSANRSFCCLLPVISSIGNICKFVLSGLYFESRQDGLKKKSKTLLAHFSRSDMVSATQLLLSLDFPFSLWVFEVDLMLFQRQRFPSAMRLH